jgi:hypothetical protein
MLFSASIANAQLNTLMQNFKDSIPIKKQSPVQEQRATPETSTATNPTQVSSTSPDTSKAALTEKNKLIISQYLSVFKYYSSQFGSEKNNCESSYKQLVSNSTETIRKNAQQSPSKKAQDEQLQLAELFTNTRSIAARAACFLRFSYETEFLLTGKLTLGDEAYDYILKNQLSQAGVKTVSDFLKISASVWAPQYLKAISVYPTDLDNAINLMSSNPGYGCKTLNKTQNIYECN